MKINFTTVNAAFLPDNYDVTKWERDYVRNEEIKRVLKNICNQLDNGNDAGKCIDINGNVIGKWEL